MGDNVKPLSEEEIAELDARLRNACADHVKYGHPGSAAVVLKYHELAALLATAREAAELREQFRFFHELWTSGTENERDFLHTLAEYKERAEKAERQVEAERERCARVCDDEAEALRVSHEPGAAMCFEDAARRIREPPKAEEPTP